MKVRFHMPARTTSIRDSIIRGYWQKAPPKPDARHDLAKWLVELVFRPSTHKARLTPDNLAQPSSSEPITAASWCGGTSTLGTGRGSGC